MSGPKGSELAISGVPVGGFPLALRGSSCLGLASLAR